jgi:hypothetical protein
MGVPPVLVVAVHSARASGWITTLMAVERFGGWALGLRTTPSANLAAGHDCHSAERLG